ncbi:ESX secretion-associated protein EspG [Nocardia sp. NBC_01503]|uniref:ESX secretion-associated protein EspG n=1 Tax=Nocardia sp. NBC_01503 TaxID=2975997 RepID=UPI002E7AECEC|nr:ESX secretion-associated protein EspG [Nocardia sp. NBC_01503]WTL29916.1 ESX secretion-associated protein EspG [Nocardia sp. NBC_01503]
MINDPVAVDLNVDAALLLQSMVGIDSYPMVLAIMPNIESIDDRDRVNAFVAAQLTEAGILGDGGVHPVIAHWLGCLARPDVELVARIIDHGVPGEPPGMLRMSLARSGETHVLAVRHDDHLVIQSVFVEGERTDAVAAALLAALGPASALDFTPLTATDEEFDTVPADAESRRPALVQLGAQGRTAAVLTRALDEVVRRAEVLMIEHHDGIIATPELCMTVLDTHSGRIAVVPHRDLNGQVRTTYRPGDDASVRAGVRALVDLLPGESWFRTSRT